MDSLGVREPDARIEDCAQTKFGGTGKGGMGERNPPRSFWFGGWGGGVLWGGGVGLGVGVGGGGVFFWGLWGVLGLHPRWP